MKNIQQTRTKTYPAILNCIPDNEIMPTNIELEIRETIIQAWGAYVSFSKLMAGIYSLNFFNRKEI